MKLQIKMRHHENFEPYLGLLLIRLCSNLLLSTECTFEYEI